MTAAACSDTDFIRLFTAHGAAETARRLKVGVRKVYERRAGLEKRGNLQIASPSPHTFRRSIDCPHRLELAVESGVVLIGSDSHYWPGNVTTAHRAFVKFCRDLKPKAVIKNGDELDGATISRFPSIGWENRPALVDEIEETKARLEEIKSAAKGAETIWNLGNHDGRFESRLAQVAPEYAKIHGVHLKDHFPDWHPAWATWINDDVVVKHRWKSGIHAAFNNTLWAGKSIFTGHLHRAQIYMLNDYNGVRWGGECGTLAEPYGPQFTDYTEDNPKTWASAFLVLTFWKGTLLQPEIVRVHDKDHVDFRGKLIRV